MKLLFRLCLSLLFTASIYQQSYADSMLPYKPYEVQDGNCTLKSSPASQEQYNCIDCNSNAGKTSLYQNGKLIAEYPWYAQADVFCGCRSEHISKFNENGQVNCVCNNENCEPSVVRHEKWPAGSSASDTKIALEFYKGAKKLKTYSTLDIAMLPDNVVRTASHYFYLRQSAGYKRGVYSITTIDGREIQFNLLNGEVLSGVVQTSAGPQLCYDNDVSNICVLIKSKEEIDENAKDKKS
jgi:hypothetical protein